MEVDKGVNVNMQACSVPIARYRLVALAAAGLAARLSVGCSPDDLTATQATLPDAEAPAQDGAGPRDAATGVVDAAVADAKAPTDAKPPAPTSAQQLCVDTINQYRQTLKLPPLARWTASEPCADGQALADGKTGVAHGAFGKCGESAQNECPGWPGAPEAMIGGCLKMMWAEGPGADFSLHGHYLNMSSTKYTTVACGFATAPNGATWSVQDFK